MTVTPAAVVLAGGRGTRLGGVRKADLVVDGHRLLDVVLDAVASCSPVVVVGESELVVPDSVHLTREDPPFSGPAAALGAGIAMIERLGVIPDWVLCLGVDQPGVAGAVPRLIEASTHAPAAVEAITASGTDAARIEWVCSILRLRALADAVSARGPAGLVDISMRSLLGDLHRTHVAVPDDATDDIDTWEDLTRWQNAPEPT